MAHTFEACRIFGTVTFGSLLLSARISRKWALARVSVKSSKFQTETRPLVGAPVGGVIGQAVNIILWAIVAIFVIYVLFGLLGCLGGLHGSLLR